MNKYIKLSSPFVFLLSLILILTLKTLPSGKLWKNYSVLCVPVSAPDAQIMQAIKASGINNTVSLSGQYLPISLSENSVELSMLRLNYGSSEYSYVNKRNLMFFDKSQNYRLYYIPLEYSAELNQLIKNLQGQGIECIKDNSANYPWLLPLIGFLLALMLFLFVKNKLPFIFASIIPLVFLYSNPFYPVACSSCLILLTIFFISNIWRRKGAFITLLNRHALPAMAAIALLSAFASSLSTGFLFLLSILGTAAALISSSLVEDFFTNRKPFIPVYIRSTKRVSMFAGKAFTSMSIVTAAVLILIVLIFVTSSNSISSSNAKLLFPAKSNNLDETLPQFEDYYKWSWNVKTAPYQSLNENSDNNSVSFPEYIEDSESGIISERKITMQYDDSFRKEVYKGIDSLQFDSVEKVMKSEGEDYSGAYTASSSYQINLFGIIMCFICLFILLFIYLSIIIRKGIIK